jgi:hypothetical protein
MRRIRPIGFLPSAAAVPLRRPTPTPTPGGPPRREAPLDRERRLEPFREPARGWDRLHWSTGSTRVSGALHANVREF